MIFILAILSAWEEVQQLVQRGSWNKDNFYSFLFWETKWDSKWKLFDSHHIAFGLFVLVMMVQLQGRFDLLTLNLTQFLFQITLFSQTWNTIAQVIAHWLIFFYIRDLFMHIFFRKKNLEWVYIFPPLKYILPNTAS